MMECFIVNLKDIENRLDVQYFRPSLRILEHNLGENDIISLGEIATFQYGAGETAKNHGDIRYIRITDIDEYGRLKNDNIAYLDYSNNLQKYKLVFSDILVARTGATYAKSYFFDEEFDAVFAGYLIRIKIKENVSLLAKYLFYFMQTSFYWLQANQIMTGGGQPQFNANTIGQLKIPFPPLEIQNQIIQIMDNAYKIKKEKEEEAKRLLESIDVYVLDQLGIEYPEMQDKMTYSVSSEELKNKRIDAYYFKPRFEKIHESIKDGKYDVKPLEEIITDLKNGVEIRKYSNTGYRYLRVTDLEKYGISNNDKKFVEVNEIPEKIKLNSNSFLISRSGSLGLVSASDKVQDCILSSHIFKVGLDRTKINPYYLEAFFRSSLGQYQFMKNNNGGIVPEINQSALKSLFVVIPPLKVQYKIAEEVQSRMQKAEKLKEEAVHILEEAKAEVEKLILT